MGRDHRVLLRCTNSWSPEVAGEILRWLSTSMGGPVVAVLDEWGLPGDLEKSGP